MQGFPGGSVVKNLPANAGDAGLIPVSGRSPGVGNSNPLHIIAWKISWTEKPGGLQSMGLQNNQIQLNDKTIYAGILSHDVKCFSHMMSQREF